MVLTATAKWALLAGLLSAYWLVPSLAALGAGSHVTQFSESLDGIAAPSSFGEVVRGLGLWPLYGQDVDGPWQPGFVSYLTNPLIVVASFFAPILLVASANWWCVGRRADWRCCSWFRPPSSWSGHTRPTTRRRSGARCSGPSRTCRALLRSGPPTRSGQ